MRIIPPRAPHEYPEFLIYIEACPAVVNPSNISGSPVSPLSYTVYHGLLTLEESLFCACEAFLSFH